MQRGFEVFGMPTRHGGDKRFPARKILIEGSHAHAGALGDSVRGRTGEAVFDQNASGSVENGLNEGPRPRLLRRFSCFHNDLHVRHGSLSKCDFTTRAVARIFLDCYGKIKGVAMGFVDVLGRSLGRWWVCGGLFAVSLLLFGWIVPHGVEQITAGRTLAPKILDEYIMTWTPADARRFYEAIGPTGREAYRAYYLHLDFWFPVLTLTLFYMSLLSLAFRPGSRLGWLNLTPLLLYASDGAENLNHFTMAGVYPDLSDFSLSWGPWFTFTKWVLIFALPILAAVGLGAQRLTASWARARRGNALSGGGR